MNPSATRRQFLATTTAALFGAGFGLLPRLRAAEPAAPSFKTKLHKALIRDHPTEDEFKMLKDAGFEGVEGGIIPQADAEKCRAIADKLGMRIHSVLRGWAEFNSQDESKVEATLKKTEDALRAAQGFGADAVLL